MASNPETLTGKPASFQLPADLRKPVDEAEIKLKKKGVTRSELLAESVRDGFPTAFARLMKRKARLSLRECVEDLVDVMNGDITSGKVIIALKKQHASVVSKYDDRTLSANVASYLRRLVERKVLQESGPAKESNGSRNQAKVYRRIKK